MALIKGFSFEPNTPVSIEVPDNKYIGGFSELIKALSFTNLTGFRKLGIEADM